MKFSVFIFSIILISISGIAQLPNLSWTEIPIKEEQKSAGFIDVQDVDGDGIDDVILSTLMEEGSMQNHAETKGAVRVFSFNESVGINTDWNEEIVLNTDHDLPFINTPQVIDVNEDGDMDIIVQQGFLKTEGGSYQWLEGPDFSQLHAFNPATAHGQTQNFWLESAQLDLDGDGKKDLLTTFSNISANPDDYTMADKAIEWYRHLGEGQFERYTINDSLGGDFIKHYDVNNDGKEDIVVAQFFKPTEDPCLLWLEQVEAPAETNSWQGVWNVHTIDATIGLGYYFEFYDIDADGQDELVAGNHNNLDNTAIVDSEGNSIESGVFYFEIPANPETVTQWEKTVIDQHFPIDLMDMGNPASQGSPGIFSIGDIDGNGMPDVALTGDGTNDLFIIRQDLDGTFTRETLGEGRMWGTAKIKDIDNDGQNEVVAAMHNYPGNILEFAFMPKGRLMVYDPVYETTSVVNKFEKELILFPNPAKNTIFIDNASVIESVLIYDVSGRVVLQESSSLNKIDISNLEKGNYIIKINTQTNKLIKQIIKI